ncbi:hypothetical protein H8E88_02510 [candidate division KSB1 bacterium]|nr:hypothetical protein [candidate division KSB1 bacterium]
MKIKTIQHLKKVVAGIGVEMPVVFEDGDILDITMGSLDDTNAVMIVTKVPPNNTVEDRQAKRVGVCKVCGKTGSNYSCKACYKETLAT